MSEKQENNNTFLIKLHPAEQKLIKTIRAINKGEIESIKIQDGVPVTYKIALGGGTLGEKNHSE
jgi:hypothetical protein